jgi:hypothetical protein
MIGAGGCCLLEEEGGCWEGEKATGGVGDVEEGAVSLLSLPPFLSSLLFPTLSSFFSRGEDDFSSIFFSSLCASSSSDLTSFDSIVAKKNSNS